VLKLIGQENVFPTQPGIGAALDAAWKKAQTWLKNQPEAEGDKKGQ
jgi:hypothetical protein